MTRTLALLFAVLLNSSAFAQLGPGQGMPIGPGSGGGGGGGSGVSSLSTACPSTGPSSGAVTLTNTLPPAQQTGANYAIQSTDCGTLVLLNNGSNQIPTIAQAGTAGFEANKTWAVCDIGAGTQTITPTTSQINGASTYVLVQNQCVLIVSDGANYQIGDVGTTNGAGITSGTIANARLTGTGSITIDSQTCTLGSTCTPIFGFPTTGYVSSNYYPSSYSVAGGATGAALVASTVYCTPYGIGPAGMTFKNFAVNVTTGDAAPGHISMALYNSGTNGLPSTKVIDIGTTGVTLSASTGLFAGAPTVNPSTVTSGTYWTCFSSDSTVARFASSANNRFVDSVMGASAITNVVNATGGGNFNGVNCTAGTTCQGSSFVWSGSTFTWPAALTTSTWSNNTTGGTMPQVALQAN